MEHPYATAVRKMGEALDGKITERWAFSDDTKAITDFFGS